MSGFDADIIVVGAGPVGMCAAIEAGRRGKSVIVLERREAEDPAGAKCNTVAARTMEGIAIAAAPVARPLAVIVRLVSTCGCSFLHLHC